MDDAPKQFPKEEMFALTDQMRRCVISIPSNIVEGGGRRTHKDTLQFCIFQEVLCFN